MFPSSITRALCVTLCSLAWLYGGISQVRAHGAYDEELKHLSEQILASPNDAVLWFQRARTSFFHGDWQACLADVEKAERLAPGLFPYDFQRGQALALGGHFNAARTVLDDFIKAHPDHGPAIAARARILDTLGHHDAALADFRAALTKKPEPEPDLYQEVAEAMTAGNRKDEAVQVLESGIEHLGNIPSLVLKALDLELSTRRFDAALLRVDAMQHSSPRPEPWMARRASVLAQAGRLDASRTAWTALREHIAALPNLERGSNAMSQLSMEAGKALAALNGTRSVPEAVAQAPAVQVTKVDPTAMFPSRSALGPGSKYEEELDRMDRMVLQDPTNAQYRFQRGELNFLDGKWQWARQDCEEAERLAPGKFPVDRLRA
ncbi:MAG: hypothetical protein JWO94_977, partial [Verrucomicrobiaceae bacterium]|nr:hypothetical protein [Verrucomicrobiaceae bacterium]